MAIGEVEAAAGADHHRNLLLAQVALESLGLLPGELGLVILDLQQADILLGRVEGRERQLAPATDRGLRRAILGLGGGGQEQATKQQDWAHGAPAKEGERFPRLARFGRSGVLRPLIGASLCANLADRRWHSSFNRPWG